MPKKSAKPAEKSSEEEFKHRVRVCGVVLDGNLNISTALTHIKGMGQQISNQVITITTIDRNAKLGTLDEKDIGKLEDVAENLGKHLPAWMLNARKYNENGKDMHFTGADLTMKNRDDINLQKRIKSYRGLRHSQGLPVRGQRTQTSFRTGITLGVKRKKVKT